MDFSDLKENYGSISANLCTDNFKIYSLNEIMRQKECQQFALLLNRLRECKYSKEDVEQLKSRIIDNNTFKADYPLYTPHIFLQNKLVDSFNNQVFTQSEERELYCKAVDVDIGNVSQEVNEKVKRSILDDMSNGITIRTQSFHWNAM